MQQPLAQLEFWFILISRFSLDFVFLKLVIDMDDKEGHRLLQYHSHIFMVQLPAIVLAVAGPEKLDAYM